MANWCYGTITVSGTKDNVERFIGDGLQHVNHSKETCKPIQTSKIDEVYELHVSDITDEIYVDALHRCFLTDHLLDIISNDENHYEVDMRVQIA